MKRIAMLTCGKCAGRKTGLTSRPSLKLILSIAWLGVDVLAVPARAQEGKQIWEEFGNRVEASAKVSPLGPDLFGDQVSLSNGALSFSATDVSLPGNNGLQVAFTRTFTVSNRKEYKSDSPLADWNIEAPHISGIFAPDWVSSANGTPGKRCSVSDLNSARPPASLSVTWTHDRTDFWQGNTMHLPGVGGGELLLVDAGTNLPTAGGPYYWVTSDQTVVSCLPSIKNGTGEGFLATTPDGTRYWFDSMAQYWEPLLGSGANIVQRRKNVLYASRVEDRFGNRVDYAYTNAWNAPARLTSISSSDGRQINIQYNSLGHVTRVDNGLQAWHYQYGSANATNQTLTAVIQPDNSRWSINFSAFTNAVIDYPEPVADEVYRDCLINAIPLAPFSYSASLVHPTGATGQFVVDILEHGRSSVPVNCLNFTPPGGPSQFKPTTNDDFNFWTISYLALTLGTKRISGPGLATAEWNYSYEPNYGVYFYPGSSDESPMCPTEVDCSQPPCMSDSCAAFSTTTVTGPGGEWTRYNYGNTYRYNEGKLLKVETGMGLNILRTTVSSFDLSQQGQVYPIRSGTSPRERGDGFTSEYIRPQQVGTTTQDGVTFTSQVIGFDKFARPLGVTKFNSLGYRKDDTTEYYDDLGKWAIGQIRRSTTNGIETARTDYNAQALPERTYRFGKPQHTLGYYADGTLNTVTDGRNYTTTLSNWHRGIPRLIQHPDGTAQSATVNDAGWITSVTDENNFATSYGYDSMGRVASIVYPQGDSVGWNNTARVFEQIGTAEYGIAAGHWREMVTTGNGRKAVYYDALWRPLVEAKYDMSDVDGTHSVNVTHYDTSGRAAFKAYPLRFLGDFNAASQGVRTTYDALDRVRRVEQDSELGVLASTTEYLSGFETRATNPRGHQTITSYLAWDQPFTDLPVVIGHPENARTWIHRDIFGKPLWIKRYGAQAGQPEAVRRYVYDGFQQLCKTIEPETGATVIDYDAAGNLIRSAAGLGLPDTSGASCQSDRDTAYLSGRRIDRYYNSRNRLTSMQVSGGNGTQDWTYTADGLPSQIITYNDAGTTAVINRYYYNRRRMLTAEVQDQSDSWYSWRIGYDYNANGSLTGQTYPTTGMYIDYAPNALGQPTRAGMYANNVRYHPNGGIASFTYGNGIVHTMQQNTRQLPVRSTDSGGVLDHQYVYDKNANVQYIYDQRNPADHRYLYYDGLDRLTSAGSQMFLGDNWHRFSYDVLDNLKSWTLGGVKDYAYYDYDGSNRLTNIRNSAGSSIVGIGYDVQGNLANKNGQAYNFDYGNRLRSVTNQEHYRYDGQGRRVRAWSPTLGSILSQYTLGGQLLYQHDDRKGKGIEHVYLGGSLVATVDRLWAAGQTVTKYQHTEALGSPVAVTNSGGQVIERTNYEPYGKLIPDPSKVDDPPKDGPGYTGHVLDTATGLNYMQQRYYDPGIGRFLSVDPIAANANTGAMFNRYNYANNNPYRFIDPDGRRGREVTDSVREPSLVRRRVPPTGTRIVSRTSEGAGALAAANGLGAGGLGVDAAAIAASGVASSNARSGLLAAEDVMQWSEGARKLGFMGAAAGGIAGAAELTLGADAAAKGHGAFTFTLSFAAVLRIIPTPAALAAGVIDLGVQQIDYTSSHLLPGRSLSGWSAVGAAYADTVIQNNERGVPLACDKPCY